MVEHRNFSFRMGTGLRGEANTGCDGGICVFGMAGNNAGQLGLSTNRLEPMLQFWQQDAGLRLPCAAGAARALS
jgi:hypothetical protein